LNIGIIILAAGNSSRLGRPKQLLKRGEVSMIQYIHQECVNSKLGPVYIITGAYHEVISKEIKSNIIENKNWKNGMATTISFAMRNINTLSLDGIILALSDQVYLSSSILQEIAQEARNSKSKIVNCQYQNGMGPPTYFDKSLFVELEQLTEGDGAKSIVKKYNNYKSSIQFPLGDIDLDVESDLDVLKSFE